MGNGWNGRPARSRRQLAAELEHEEPADKRWPVGHPQSGGRVARRNGPVARSTQQGIYLHAPPYLSRAASGARAARSVGVISWKCSGKLRSSRARNASLSTGLVM